MNDNKKVFIPVINSTGVREPKTTVNLQPLNGRVLVKACYSITNFELVGIDTSKKNHENAMLQRKPDSIEVVAYGAYSAQVLIGDKIVMLDEYSAINIAMPDDIKWYKNVIKELSTYKNKLLNKFDSKSSTIIMPTNPLLESMGARNEKEFNDGVSTIHVYFMIDEFVISHRLIDEPNA